MLKVPVDGVTGEDLQWLYRVAWSIRDELAFSKSELGYSDSEVLEIKFKSEDQKPIALHPYASNAEDTAFMQAEVAMLLKNGLIEETVSPWGSPVVVAKRRM